MKTTLRSTALLAAALSFASGADAQNARRDHQQQFQELATLQGLSDSARLHRLFALDWEFQMTEFPEYATLVGYPGQNDRWTDRSVASLRRRANPVRAQSAVLRSIERDRLPPADQLSYDIFKRGVDEEIEGQRFPRAVLALTKLDGPQYFPDIIDAMPASTATDYEDIVRRIERIPTVIEQTIALLDSGLTLGVTPPRVTLTQVPHQLTGLTPAEATKSALLATFARMPATIPEADRARLMARAASAYDTKARPAYQRLRAYLTDTYIPRARETLGMSKLPDGQAWYAYRVKVMTTTGRTPREIHDLGLSEVKRIRAAMDSVIRSTGFTGNFAAFVTMLRTDPRFFYTDSASLVRAYRDIAKRVDPELPKLFGRIPRLPYGVTTIPSYAAPSQTTAYYWIGSPAAHRPGWFYVNTYKLDTRPIWEMEALSIHEAVPGHHFQIALAQELEGLPEFRKHGLITAFVEGWGLYSESLGTELGFYRDPYSKFGQLTYEMWRAIRLVLDTGIHSFDWTRDQGIEYFKANSAKTENDIVVEVDRYISDPGQALAYKSGELTMKALRRHAEQELGARFDIRAFHDELLGQGALPLDVLEQRMRAWVAREKSRTRA
jgi:uncharacterized protein (DUF885 family)